MTGITINPQQITNAAGTFYVSSDGGMQGMFLDDPAIRNELVSAVVSPAQSTPLWGGMGIVENLPTAGTEAASIGSVLALATSAANLTGFTVFNQSLAMINSPQSPVPLAAAGGGTTLVGGAINFFRLGSGARIWVGCSSVTAAAFAGSAVGTAAYWDYTNQVLLSAPGGTAIPVKVLRVSTSANAMVVAFSGGLATWNYAGYAAMIQI